MRTERVRTPFVVGIATMSRLAESMATTSMQERRQITITAVLSTLTELLMPGGRRLRPRQLKP